MKEIIQELSSQTFARETDDQHQHQRSQLNAERAVHTSSTPLLMKTQRESFKKPKKIHRYEDYEAVIHEGTWYEMFKISLKDSFNQEKPLIYAVLALLALDIGAAKLMHEYHSLPKPSIDITAPIQQSNK